MTASCKGAHTPENMTRLMVTKLGFNLEQYDDYSNAYLATMEDFIEGPIWVMNLYSGRETHYAIFEEIARPGESRLLYIYPGLTRPTALIDMEQSWERKIKRGGKILRQIGRVFSNYKLEPCLKWTTLE